MKKKKILAVIVNYGTEQLGFLKKMISNLNDFQNYDVDIIINSNIELKIRGVSSVNVFKLDNYQLLPSTCRKTLWENRNKFDVFIYSENDHLITEKHIDNHIYYTSILPTNRIAGLIQFEEDFSGVYFPGYHGDFDWEYKTVEEYGGKKFAHFTNLHQAGFILTNEQLNKIGKRFNFNKIIQDKVPLWYKIKKKVFKAFKIKIKEYYIYDDLCKVGTDIYKFGGMKKVICISEFEDNLIHHMPNIYINGKAGRKKQRSDENRMNAALERLLSKNR